MISASDLRNNIMGDNAGLFSVSEPHSEIYMRTRDSPRKSDTLMGGECVTISRNRRSNAKEQFRTLELEFKMFKEHTKNEIKGLRRENTNLSSSNTELKHQVRSMRETRREPQQSMFPPYAYGAATYAMNQQMSHPYSNNFAEEKMYFVKRVLDLTVKVEETNQANQRMESIVKQVECELKLEREANKGMKEELKTLEYAHREILKQKMKMDCDLGNELKLKEMQHTQLMFKMDHEREVKLEQRDNEWKRKLVVIENECKIIIEQMEKECNYKVDEISKISKNAKKQWENMEGELEIILKDERKIALKLKEDSRELLKRKMDEKMVEIDQKETEIEKLQKCIDEKMLEEHNMLKQYDEIAHELERIKNKKCKISKLFCCFRCFCRKRKEDNNRNEEKDE